jgi:hypothetical protein
MYIRFITGEIHDNSSYELGVFQAAYRLRRTGHLPQYEETRLTELLDWFNANLKKPTRFTTSKPPYYRKQSRGISWFKDTATEHISKLREVVSILSQHDVHTELIQTDRPGYIVYEDNYQIVSEPFSDADF